jgi:hypothetical protein
MNARNMTRLVVTPEAEVANPWGAVCGESRTHGFDAGVGKRAHQSTSPCPKRPGMGGHATCCCGRASGRWQIDATIDSTIDVSLDFHGLWLRLNLSSLVPVQSGSPRGIVEGV